MFTFPFFCHYKEIWPFCCSVFFPSHFDMDGTEKTQLNILIVSGSHIVVQPTDLNLYYLCARVCVCIHVKCVMKI